MSADKSPEELQREVEQTRSEISETLDEIERQLSPGQMLDQALGYFGGSRQIGLAVGGLVVRNPVPVALIGLGFAWLAFAGSRSRRRELYEPMWAEPGGRWSLPKVERNVLMAVSRENLAEWLRDARTMEDLAIETLERQAGRLDEYPELQAKLREHLTESHRQAERLDGCLQRLSTTATVASSARSERLPGGEQIAALLGGGPVIQNGITGYAFEHFEIATYRTLAEAAAEADEPEIERVCRENLREEEAMAAWLAHRIPDVTRQYLYRQAAGRTEPVATAGVPHQAADTLG